MFKNIKSLLNVSIATLSLFALAACSNQVVVEPQLTDAKFECKLQPIKPGEDAVVTGRVKNKGGEFKGIKITLKGSALSESVVAMPVPGRSSLDCKYASQDKLIISAAKTSFTLVDRGTLELTLPDFDCKGDIIDLKLAMPADRQGTGDLQITVTPISFPKKESSTWITIQVKQPTGIFMGG
jgi:hypothetical protein